MAAVCLQVVGFGVEENDPPSEEPPSEEGAGGDDGAGAGAGLGKCSVSSTYGEVSKLTFLPASPRLASATAITDIRAFTAALHLYPYHKILK